MITHDTIIKTEFCIFPKNLFNIGSYGFLVPSGRQSNFFERVRYVEMNNKKFYIFKKVGS